MSASIPASSAGSLGQPRTFGFGVPAAASGAGSLPTLRLAEKSGKRSGATPKELLEELRAARETLGFAGFVPPATVPEPALGHVFVECIDGTVCLLAGAIKLCAPKLYDTLIGSGGLPPLPFRANLHVAEMLEVSEAMYCHKKLYVPSPLKYQAQDLAAKLRFAKSMDIHCVVKFYSMLLLECLPTQRAFDLDQELNLGLRKALLYNVCRTAVSGAAKFPLEKGIILTVAQLTTAVMPILGEKPLAEALPGFVREEQWDVELCEELLSHLSLEAAVDALLASSAPPEICKKALAGLRKNKKIRSETK